MSTDHNVHLELTLQADERRRLAEEVEHKLRPNEHARATLERLRAKPTLSQRVRRLFRKG